MSISKNIMMWIILFIVFSAVTGLILYAPDWIKENDTLYTIVMVSIGVALALGFMYIAWR